MMNLEKRIKRHLIGSQLEFFAVTLPGCELSCRRTLERLSDTVAVHGSTRGGVLFSGRLTDLYLANLHLQTAGRVLLRLAKFKATAFRQLQKRAAGIPWALYLAAGTLPRLKVTARRSRLRHTGAIEARLQQTIKEHWVSAGIDPVSEPGQCLYVRLQDDVATLSLDSSGENLYRRGLKTHRAEAPIRETMAAHILHQSDYRPSLPLVDPMCGSGTFSLEAAMMAKGIPAGYYRHYAFMQWPAFRPRHWRFLKKTAAAGFKHFDHPHIHASDVDPSTCRGLSGCVRAYGLDDIVQVRCMDFFSLQGTALSDRPGLVVLNPPYGRRLKAKNGKERYLRQIAAKLIHDFKGWSISLLIPGHRTAEQLKLPVQAIPMMHGGLKVTLLAGRI